jgi:hypothetical protein
LYVQQQDLQAMLNGRRAAAANQETVAAVGGLIAVLNQRQAAVRRDFAQTFAEFNSMENQERVKKLFG